MQTSLNHLPRLTRRPMSAPSGQCPRAPARALARAASLNRSSSVHRNPAARSTTTYSNGRLTGTTPSGKAIAYTFNSQGQPTGIALDGTSLIGSTIKDPKNLTTTYVYNGLGDMLSQISADKGITGFTYDSAGNISHMFFRGAAPLPFGKHNRPVKDLIAYLLHGTMPADLLVAG